MRRPSCADIRHQRRADGSDRDLTGKRAAQNDAEATDRSAGYRDTCWGGSLFERRRWVTFRPPLTNESRITLPLDGNQLSPGLVDSERIAARVRVETQTERDWPRL
jgi:hypothetical protein